MTLPRAEALAAALVGRPVSTYLWGDGRVVRVEDGVILVAGYHGPEDARVRLADVQAGLDQLDAAGEVPVTVDALGPWATYVAAMLVGVEDATFADAPARVKLSERPVAG
ncbi:MAG: hypothetical protein MSC31_13155 [Solirubrobacteraceae bacterium MAG38_C4-C5]|nr:hypothetical protein [Candidatus Siliceabacter maunaloa]